MHYAMLWIFLERLLTNINFFFCLVKDLNAVSSFDSISFSRLSELLCDFGWCSDRPTLTQHSATLNRHTLSQREWTVASGVGAMPKTPQRHGC